MLRFPLIIGVLFIHALPDVIQKMEITDVWNDSHILWSYKYISELCSHAIPLIAVPLFFFISGYYTLFQKDWSKRDIIKTECKKKGKRTCCTISNLEYLNDCSPSTMGKVIVFIRTRH